MHKKGEKKLTALAIKKYNIRDTKQFYSSINNMAAKGLEVITYNAARSSEEVSHIKKEYLDFLLESITFKPRIIPDERIGGYSIEIEELGSIYGEGDTKETAVENLVDNILEYLEIYLEKIDLYSQMESLETKIYVLKLLRCDGDREQIRKALNL